MKPAIHLLDPVTGTADKIYNYINARCGRVQQAAKMEVTTNPAEVTCIKCRNYMNNPYRVMRKYGRVKVLESFYVILWADYGNKLDLVAIADVPGTWVVTMALSNKIHTKRAIAANNMDNLGFQLLKIYEKEITELKSESL
jgi:hypothetical protein